ncbi:hypothetical protein BDW71DRAFT_146849 [Aspergillus fruticulosus]
MLRLLPKVLMMATTDSMSTLCQTPAMRITSRIIKRRNLSVGTPWTCVIKQKSDSIHRPERGEYFSGVLFVHPDCRWRDDAQRMCFVRFRAGFELGQSFDEEWYGFYPDPGLSLGSLFWEFARPDRQEPLRYIRMLRRGGGRPGEALLSWEGDSLDCVTLYLFRRVGLTVTYHIKARKTNLRFSPEIQPCVEFMSPLRFLLCC